MGQARILVTLGALVLVASAPLAAEEALFQVVDTEAAPGQDGVLLPVAAALPAPAQGLSMAMRHVCDGCAITAASVENTSAYGADFVSVLADDTLGTCVVGLLMDADPPFDGRMIPASPEPTIVLHLVLSIAAGTTTGDYAVSFVPEGLPSGDAWVTNSYASGNESYEVTALEGGILKLGNKPQDGLPLFVRGDANQDLIIDISDPIGLLESLYGGGGLPRCIDACDANDDGTVNIADAIYTLGYLFNDGAKPPIPFGDPGLDWTPDYFGCDDPEAGWMTDFWPE